MAKIIKHGAAARQAIKAGIDKVADTVKMTLGPRGRNAAIHNAFGAPTITNDGVTIARHIFLKDEFESLGAELMKQVAWNSNERAGDGTTTSTVIAQELCAKGMEAIDAEKGINPMVLKRQLEAGVKVVVQAISEMSKPVTTPEEIARVGTISSGSEEVGRIISEIFKELGNDAIVTMEQSSIFGYSWEIVEGFELDRGLVSPYMATNMQTLEATLADIPVIVSNAVVQSPADLATIVDIMAKNNWGTAVLFCQELSGAALEAVLKSKADGHFNLVVVRAPGVGDNQEHVLEDVAVLLGAKFISRDKGMRLYDITEECFGGAKKATIGRSFARFVYGNGSEVAVMQRSAELEAALTATTDQFEKTKIQERLERFQKGVGVVKIGAASETELKEKLYRLEDAINATKHAAKEGIVPGGGIALLRAQTKLGDSVGERILKQACCKPFAQILHNTGIEAEDAIRISEAVTQEGLPLSTGFNAETEQVEDLYEAGVIDPTRVVISEIENATSVANTLLTVESAIVEEPGKELNLEDIKKDLLGTE